MISRRASTVQEHFVEVRLAGDLLDRADLDAVLAHREEEERDAAVLRDVPVSAGHQHPVVGRCRTGRPHLLTGDDELVAVALGASLQAGEVRSCSWLGVQQAHLEVVEQQRPDQAALQCFGSERQQGVGPEVVDVLRGAGCADAAELLDDDSSVGRAHAQSEAGLRPRGHRVAGVDDELQPFAPGSIGAPVRLQPATNVGLQRCGVRGVNITSGSGHLVEVVFTK